MMIVLKRIAAVVLSLLILLACAACASERKVDSLTYALFPYLPDVEYYQELIERRWAEIEPEIRLVRADWDCYTDDAPKDIDVVMYDAVMQNALIANGWIKPIAEDAVQDAEDLFPFAVDGLFADGKLYGIPVFLCGNFLIYDRSCDVLANAEHITDLADETEFLVINSDDAETRAEYFREVLADTLGEANPAAGKSNGRTDAIMALIDRLAIDVHAQDQPEQVACAYDAGAGMGYISFSETMRFLERRGSTTDIKSVSFGDGENLPRLYVDAVSVTSGVDGMRYEKCIELMNVIADADILTSLSVQDGKPQYLLLARKSAYAALTERFPLYRKLEEIASNEQNCTILGQ